ncbi:MAG: outer membrane beta-barrel protein [Elusimicrobia bacterium]|nr:outer membrane beta-barrel protein [Elusimicrobiota bacterium]
MVLSGKGHLRFMTVLAALIALPAATPAFAGLWSAMQDFKRPNMRWGLLEFHPYAKVTETYDSNIYLVPEDKNTGARVGGGVVGSWITSGLVGAKLNLPISAMHNVGVDYNFEGLAYSKQASANNTIHQRADLAYGYKGPMGISGKIRDNYLNTTDPAFSELVEREQRWQNTLGGDVEYAPLGGNLFAGVDVAHTAHKYVGPTLGALLNRYEQSAGLRAGYKVMPKTRVYLAYHRAITHYSAGRRANHKDNLLDAGIEGDIAPKVKGQIQAGLSNRLYDEAPVTTQPTSRNLFSIGTKLTWKPQDRCTFNLGLMRALQESTFGANRFYESSLIALGGQHKFPHKLTAGVNLSVGWDKYPIANSPTTGVSVMNRRDDIYQQALTLDYAVQEWMRAGIGYLHRTRWAKNFSDQFNYEDHQTSINLGLTF